MRLKGRGRLITFEGTEGTGKTTQLKKLQQALKRQGYPVLSTQEPGGTSLGEKIRHLLMNFKDGSHFPEMELFLFLADRAYHVRSLITRALAKKQIVLCDRFADSTIAYQAFGRNLSRRLLEGMNKLATGGLKPDLTLFLDLPVKEGLKRAKKRPSGNRMDRENSGFYTRVRKGYYFLARNNPQITVLDASQSPEKIHQAILTKVEEILAT